MEMKLEVVVIPVSDVDRAMEFYARLGWRLDGDVSTGDATQSVKAILGDVAHTQPGSIVLMHANGRGENTEAALPRIVALLKKRGYRFVTVSQLLAAGKPVVTPACYDLKPGDTDRYDVLFRLQDAAVPLPIPAEVRRR